MSNSVPTLKEFMHKRRVLKLYKDFFRTTKQISNETSRKEAEDWIRNDFKNKMKEKNDFTKKMLIQNGERALRELQINVNLTK